MRPSLKKHMQSLEDLKHTFQGSLVIDVGEIFQGANPPEAHRQFNDGHNDDQPISQTKSDILPN